MTDQTLKTIIEWAWILAPIVTTICLIGIIVVIAGLRDAIHDTRRF